MAKQYKVGLDGNRVSVQDGKEDVLECYDYEFEDKKILIGKITRAFPDGDSRKIMDDLQTKYAELLKSR